MKSKTAVVAVGMLVLTLAGGCASERVLQINKRLTSLEAVTKSPPDASYVVDPPDSIEVEIFNEPELTRIVQVRQDGKVTLAHVGEVKVAGLTPLEIQQELEEAYGRFYKEPDILVSVAAYRSKHIYVYGEVRSEGTQPYTGYQKVSDAIGHAGGITWRAACSRVRVIRGDPREPEVYWVDLDELVFKGNSRQDVSLAEDDVVYVPPNVLAWIGYQMDNLLFPFRGVLGVLSTAESID